MDTWIHAMVKRRSLRRMIAWGLILVCTPALALLHPLLPIAGLLILALVFLKHGRREWRHFRGPSDHPLMARVKSWGDPKLIGDEAAEDARSARHKLGGWRVGEKYLVRRTLFNFDILRLSDLLWVYKHVLTRRMYRYIPMGSSYAAVLTCYQKRAVIVGREKKVDALIRSATGRVPWAVAGYSDDIATLSKARPTDFVSAVESRRAEWERKTREVSSS